MKIKTAILIIMCISVTKSTTRTLESEQDRILLFVENPDTERPFPEWLQIIYFVLCCLMILGGLAACIMCCPNKAGPARPVLDESMMNYQNANNYGQQQQNGNQYNQQQQQQDPNSSMMPLRNNNNGY